MITLKTFDDLVCSPETAIREVMARINATPYLFQVVVDGGGRVLDTVTDGDIRRAILANTTLDMPVRICMQQNAVTGRVGDDARNLEKLPALGSLVPFLPLLNEDGVLKEILVVSQAPTERATALVMAGGPGKRLGERTQETPKPLLTVGDKPILQHILERLEAVGIQNIYISVHHLAERIDAFISDRSNQARIHLIHESEPLGTAGSIGKLPRSLNEPLLVVNGDILTQVDFSALIVFHNRHGYDATIAAAQHEVELPFGVIRRNEDGMFLGVEEKPLIRNFVVAGIYYLSPQFCSLVPPGKAMDMPELLNLGRSMGLRIGLFPVHEYWVDVGRPAEFEAAQESHPAATPGASSERESGSERES